MTSRPTYNEAFEDCMVSWPDQHATALAAVRGTAGRAQNRLALWNAMLNYTSADNIRRMVAESATPARATRARLPLTGTIYFDYPGDFGAYDAVANGVYGFDPSRVRIPTVPFAQGREAFAEGGDAALNAINRFHADLRAIATGWTEASQIAAAARASVGGGTALYETYDFQAAINDLLAEERRLEGLQDADRARYETYCRGQAARAAPDPVAPSGGFMPATAPPITCPEGFERRLDLDPITQQQIQVCVPVPVATTPPPAPDRGPPPPSPTTPTPPAMPDTPVGPVIIPCPDGQERLTTGGDCVPECGDDQYRDASGDCIDNPVADPGCPSVTAVSSLPAGHSVAQQGTLGDDYVRLISGDNMTEVLKQRRPAGDSTATCISIWPTPPAIDGYTAARGDNGVVVYTAIPAMPVAPQPEPIPTTEADCIRNADFQWIVFAGRGGECRCRSGTWDPQIAACVPDPPPAPADPFGVLTGTWLRFDHDGYYYEYRIGTPAGYDGIETSATGFSVIQEIPQQLGNYRYLAVDPEIASSVTNQFVSPIFSDVFTLAPIAHTAPTGGNRPDIGGGIPVRAFNLNTGRLVGDSPYQGEDFRITAAINEANVKQVVLRIERRDKVSRTSPLQTPVTGVALALGGVSLYMKFFRYRDPVETRFTRARERTKPTDLTDEQSLAYDAYHPLVETYGANEVVLPGDGWTQETGLRQSARVLRTHAGEAVNPYRRVQARYPLRNHADAARIVPGQWVEFDHEVRGQQFAHEANVQRITYRGSWLGDHEVDIECAISPRSAEFTPPPIRLAPVDSGEAGTLAPDGGARPLG